MQRDRLLIGEIIDAAERLVELTLDRTPADFDEDRDRRDALLWNFTVLGEAVGQLSEATKGAHPNVVWSDPVALDVLVATARDDLPAFISEVETIQATFVDQE